MIKNPTKILMIMYGKSVGGAELQFIELANYLAGNHTVRLITLGGDGAVRATTINDKIELRVISFSGLVGTLLGLMNAFLCGLTFNSRYIVTTSFSGNVIGYACSLIRTSKLISLQTVSKCMRHPKLDRFILKKFNLLIAGATDIKDYLIAHGQNTNRIKVVHNWVDFSKRIPSETTDQTRAKYKLASQVTVIGCIGRFHPQKGQINLIRAYAEIQKEFPNTVLLLVGDGETRSDLENEVNMLGLADAVLFMGTVTGDEYNNLLALIEIYVQPSIFEGLPRTLLDAMYMGKAIIATDVNGNREAIRHEVNGLLVPPEDFRQIASALRRLLLSPDEVIRFAKQAKLDSLAFSMPKQLQTIELLIHEC